MGACLESVQQLCGWTRHSSFPKPTRRHCGLTDWVCGAALGEAGTREQTLQTELETLKEEKAEADEYLSEFEAASIEETGALEADKAKLQVPTFPNTSWLTGQTHSQLSRWQASVNQSAVPISS